MLAVSARRDSAPGARDHGQLVQHHRRVLDEDRVGLPGQGRQALDPAAQLGQGLLVGRVLGRRVGQVDGPALEVGQLAGRQRGADGAREGQARHQRSHRKKRSPVQA